MKLNFGRPLRRPRAIQVIACAGAGIILGTLAGVSAVGGIERSDRNGAAGEWRPAQPIDMTPPEKTNPMAREVGYSIASAWEVTTMAGCSSLDGEFRPGCRDYVREQARRPRQADQP